MLGAASAVFTLTFIFALAATRSGATLAYRTTPLRALWQHPPYFHDCSAKDLEAVVEHYNAVFQVGTQSKAEGGPGRVPQDALGNEFAR
jgi:cytochrome c peroxidase